MSMALGILGLFGAATVGPINRRRTDGTARSALGLDWLSARPRSRT